MILVMLANAEAAIYCLRTKGDGLMGISGKNVLGFALRQAVFLALFATTVSRAQSSGDPTNGLLGDLAIHDPSEVIKSGGTYYIYQTGGGFKTSTDRVAWKSLGMVFSANPTWWNGQILPPDVPQLWAGDISFWNGKYYFYYSVSAWYNFHSCIGLATNTTLDPSNPAYHWSDEGMVIDSAKGSQGGNRVNVIDPSLFQDDDGKKYLNFGSFQNGMRQVEIDPATGKMFAGAPKPTLISDGLGEASFLIKANGFYYYTCSRGICCSAMKSTYQVVYGRSRNVSGPFATRSGASMAKSNCDILLAGDATHPGQGGQSFFADHDTLFMAYHAYTAPDGRSLLNIRPVYADKYDWLTMDPSQGKVVKASGVVGLSGGRVNGDGRNSITQDYTHAWLGFGDIRSGPDAASIGLFDMEGKLIPIRPQRRPAGAVYLRTESASPTR